MSDSCLNLLAEMICFNTVGSEISGIRECEKPLAEFIEQTAQRYGLKTQRLPIEGWGFNLLITHAPAPSGEWLLFESHMDTVGVEGMIIPPFEPKVVDGRIYGRGASDTKGSGAAMLWALRKYAANRENSPNNVALLFTVDEEVRKTGINQFVDHQLSTLGWRPAGAVVGEPTKLELITAHNGVVRWVIRTKGLAAHSSDPSRGKSAISMMAKVIEAIESGYMPSLTGFDPMTGPAVCSINVIRGGSLINIIPSLCEIEIDRRILPGEDANSVLPAVEVYLDECRRKHPGLDVTQGVPFLDPALDPADNAIFAPFVTKVLERNGLNGTPLGVKYGCDACQLAKAGIPAVVLGPGDIAQAHTADEWLQVDQLEQAVQVYLTLMQSPLPSTNR